MSSAAMTTMPAPGHVSIAETRLSPNQLVAQRNAVIEAMQKTMKVDVDYGIIPGTPKPTLYKPGSEKILSMFHLAVEPRVEDLSTPDCIRYRVFVTVTHAPSGVVLGTGIGEASSAEAKYQWRAVVCDEEWNETPEDRKRTKWKKGNGGAYSVRQVRADMEDVANTVLKMAKKRAQIDATLTCTAASDMFSQDIEDLSEAGLDTGEGEGLTQSQSLPQTLQRKDAAPVNSPAPQTAQTNHTAPQQSAPPKQPSAQGGPTISEDQGKRFWAKAMATHSDYKLIMAYLRDTHGVTNKSQILALRYDEAIAWAERK
jgi:hypothetical protein